MTCSQSIPWLLRVVRAPRAPFCRATAPERLDRARQLRICRTRSKPIARQCMLIKFNQFSLDEFKRQDLVYLKGIVSMPTDMSFEHLFQRIGTKVGPTARVRVKKHLP